MKIKLSFAFSLFIFAAQPAYADISLPTFQPAMDINVAASIYRQNPSTYNNTRSSENKSQSFDRADFARALTFKTNKAASKVNLQAFADEQRRANSANGAELDRLFASQDILGLIGQEILEYGLSPNNVADAFAIHWIALWQVANQDYTDPTAATVQAVAKQSRFAFSATPAFVGITDNAKQEMAEKYLVYAAILSASAQASRSNPEIQAALVRSAKETSLQSGMNLSAITLTEQGFVATNKK